MQMCIENLQQIFIPNKRYVTRYHLQPASHTFSITRSVLPKLLCIRNQGLFQPIWSNSAPTIMLHQFKVDLQPFSNYLPRNGAQNLSVNTCIQDTWIRFSPQIVAPRSADRWNGVCPYLSWVLISFLTSSPCSAIASHNRLTTDIGSARL